MPAADTDTDTAHPPDPELVREREHLVEARRRLRAMRDRTRSLEARGGDAVSEAYLAATLHRRVRDLEDDPEVPLFFARIDLDAEHADLGDRLHVGRRHVTDASGDPLVVDWRAPVSTAFYRARRGAPMGLVARRRFGFAGGTLTAYEDERLDGSATGHPAVDPAASEILRAEVARPRSGPMRDIVATIQPEQDELVRADLGSTLCVQGAPGTGKTAVGLHRVAYLLYAHRDRLSRSGVLVVGPNDAFLRYIGDVLPALGEVSAAQTTVAGLTDRVRVTADDSPEAAAVKSSAAMAEVVSRLVWSHVGRLDEAVVVPVGSRRWRVHPWTFDEIVGELRRRGVPYHVGRDLLAQRIAHHVLVAMEDAGQVTDDRVQQRVARSAPVRACVRTAWPTLDPARLVATLLSDPALLARHADGVLGEAQQSAISWPRPRTAGRAAWTLHDAVLVDEVAGLLDRPPTAGHLVVDEAQDLSPMMWRALARRCPTGSATVLGDLAQATTPWGVRDWTEALTHLGKPAATVEQLTLGFRVPGEVLAYAARLLPVIAPTLEPPRSLRSEADALRVARVEDAVAAGVAAATSAAHEPGTTGLLVPDALVDDVSAALAGAGIVHGRLDREVDQHRLEVVPASLAKGLEHDHVVLVEPGDVVDAEPDRLTGLRRLYVCLTRAVTSLTVVHARDLPGELA